MVSTLQGHYILFINERLSAICLLFINWCILQSKLYANKHVIFKKHYSSILIMRMNTGCTWKALWSSKLPLIVWKSIVKIYIEFQRSSRSILRLLWNFSDFDINLVFDQNSRGYEQFWTKFMQREDNRVFTDKVSILSQNILWTK